MRKFLHVDDLGKACVFALENWSALDKDAPNDDQGKPLAFLNVGTGVDLTIKELAEQIAAVVGFEGTIEWEPVRRMEPQEATGRQQNEGLGLERSDISGGRPRQHGGTGSSPMA